MMIRSQRRKKIRKTRRIKRTRRTKWTRRTRRKRKTKRLKMMAKRLKVVKDPEKRKGPICQSRVGTRLEHPSDSSLSKSDCSALYCSTILYSRSACASHCRYGALLLTFAWCIYMFSVG